MSSHVLKLPIHATPGAKRTEPAGAYGEALRVRLGAPPVDGKANAALIDWAARQKMLGVHFGSAAELEAAQTLLVQWLAADGD